MSYKSDVAKELNIQSRHLTFIFNPLNKSIVPRGNKNLLEKLNYFRTITNIVVTCLNSFYKMKEFIINKLSFHSICEV